MHRSKRRAGRLRGSVCVALVAAIAGCPGDDPCGTSEDAGVTIVLTFDDGPLAADVELCDAPADRALLLDPLKRIVATLERRDARAVFYVEGPGFAEDPSAFDGAFGDGLAAIHAAGHVLGYHAFQHDRAIWVRPLVPPPIAELAMRADLDRLEAYIGRVLANRGMQSGDVFAPLFRQPYGGAGISRTPAVFAAAARGWTYRGFLIDGVDWTDHADVEPEFVAGLPFMDEASRIEFVRSRLRAGAMRNASRDVVDVLLHVNEFTAAHLDEWIDELTESFELLGRGPVRFRVPDCYLERSDWDVDLSVVTTR